MLLYLALRPYGRPSTPYAPIHELVRPQRDFDCSPVHPLEHGGGQGHQNARDLAADEPIAVLIRHLFIHFPGLLCACWRGYRWLVFVRKPKCLPRRYREQKYLVCRGCLPPVPGTDPLFDGDLDTIYIC